METRASETLVAGNEVVYGLHGKCKILSIENREVGGQSLPFYRLEIQKSALSRSTRQEPAIWVPFETARRNGLRPRMDATLATAVWEVLASREFYFDLQLSWSKAQHLLERAIAQEGALGLAKAVSYVTGIKKREVILSPETSRFAELITKQLYRELSEVEALPIRDIETRAAKALKNKLILDQ